MGDYERDCDLHCNWKNRYDKTSTKRGLKFVFLLHIADKLYINVFICTITHSRISFCWCASYDVKKLRKSAEKRHDKGMQNFSEIMVPDVLLYCCLSSH